MYISNKQEPFFLFLGDVILMVLSLVFTVFFRYGEVHYADRLAEHIGPFSVLFVVWFIVFFIAGLYEKHTLILKSKLPSTLLSAQITNTILAVLFFYLIPYFGIAPKTNLFIYLIVSFGLLFAWRHAALRLFENRTRQKGILVGSGEEIQELEREVNENKRYRLKFIKTLDPSTCSTDECYEGIKGAIKEGATLVVLDTHHPVIEEILPDLYKLLFSGVRFLDMSLVYEEIFNRIPISLVKHGWFLEHLAGEHKVYDIVKRLMDIAVGVVCGFVSLLIYPFVMLAIKLEDGGSFFYTPVRTGQHNAPFTLFKFRTMSTMDEGSSLLDSKGKVTRVGRILRASRIDELPQLWNIIRGDMSLVGPRPEFPELVAEYESHVPYYKTRHLIKPGLSGWAQMYQENHPHHKISVKDTKDKLSYDLYYIKHRSIFVDIKIALKTLKVFFTRTGR